VNGAYWKPAHLTDKTGNAAAVTTNTSPGSAEGSYLALWLNMGNPGSSESGYQLRWSENSSGTYVVKLSKWLAGAETVLASSASVAIPTETTLAISDTGGTVTAWLGSGGSLSSLLSARDTTFSNGYAGIEGFGPNNRLINFKAGVLLGKVIPGVSILDGFGRWELPLANGKWTRAIWTSEIGSSWRGQWHGYGADLSHLAGAYWNGATFSDSDGPVVCAATLGTGPIYERWPNEYLSLWLDMPNPGRVRSGYEVRFRGANRTSDAYKVVLSKWAFGRRTVLARAKRVSLPVNTKFALSEAGGSLVVWTGTRTLTPILSSTDYTYSGGYAGIEANRGEGTAYNFRAGNVAEGRHKIPSKARPGPLPPP
jgi:hypothetical protein